MTSQKPPLLVYRSFGSGRSGVVFLRFGEEWVFDGYVDTDIDACFFDRFTHHRYRFENVVFLPCFVEIH